MLEKIDTLIKMSSLQGFDLIDVTLNAAYTTPVQDVSSFRSLRGLYFSNAGTLITLNWSSDQGKNTDYQDTITQTAGVASSVSYAIKAKYLSITFTPALTPSNVRYQTLFFLTSSSLTDLENAGTGSKLYKPAEHKIRSVKSSNSSITVTELANEIDLTIPPIYFRILPAAAGMINITGNGVTIDPLIFTQVDFDIGSGYNPATGLYTVPTSGTYLFGAIIVCKGLVINHTSSNFKIIKVNSPLWWVINMTVNPYNCSHGGEYTIAGSGNVYCNAGDTVKMTFWVGGGANQVSLFQDSAFFGMRIGN